jgi:hypothetical protein
MQVSPVGINGPSSPVLPQRSAWKAQDSEFAPALSVDDDAEGDDDDDSNSPGGSAPGSQVRTPLTAAFSGMLPLLAAARGQACVQSICLQAVSWLAVAISHAMLSRHLVALIRTAAMPPATSLTPGRRRRLT